MLHAQDDFLRQVWDKDPSLNATLNDLSQTFSLPGLGAPPLSFEVLWTPSTILLPCAAADKLPRLQACLPAAAGSLRSPPWIHRMQPGSRHASTSRTRHALVPCLATRTRVGASLREAIAPACQEAAVVGFAGVLMRGN